MPEILRFKNSPDGMKESTDGEYVLVSEVEVALGHIDRAHKIQIDIWKSRYEVMAEACRIGGFRTPDEGPAVIGALSQNGVNVDV